MLRASLLKSILPLTGDEAEALPKVGTAPQAAPRTSGSVLVSGERHHQSCPPPLPSQGMLWVISTLETPPFPFSPLRQRGWHGCPRPRGEQERAWWRLPHRMSCLVPTGVCSPHAHTWLQLLKSLPKAIQSLSQKQKRDRRTRELSRAPSELYKHWYFPFLPHFLCVSVPSVRTLGSPAPLPAGFVLLGTPNQF